MQRNFKEKNPKYSTLYSQNILRKYNGKIK